MNAHTFIPAGGSLGAWVILALQAPQCTAQDVLASAGDAFVTGTTSIAFTIGEPVIATQAQSAVILTQGFQQPNDDFTTVIAEVMDPEAEVLAFPNPARDQLVIQVNGLAGVVAYELFDAAGRAIHGRSSFSERVTLDVSALASGTYHARITVDGAYITTVQLSITH